MKGSGAERTVVVITGAGGGMGRACARQLGKAHRLVLADVDARLLDSGAAALADEGCDVGLKLSLDVSKRSAVANCVREVSALGRLKAVIHTAGVSTASADWSTILEVNLCGSANILEAFVAIAGQGTVAVCIASIQGHTAPRDTALDRITDAPFEPDLLSRLEPFVRRYALRGDARGLASCAYSISKRAIMRMCEQRVREWAVRGARVVSISPGLIDTPMGRREYAENPLAARVAKHTPMQRWGTPEDIASAVEFLCSAGASFITGTDLRIDGGITPMLDGVLASVALESAPAT